MSTQTETETETKHAVTPRVVWFEIPADNIDRAKTFYSKLFGWKIAGMPDMSDYLHIDTGGSDESLDGGMTPRRSPGQQITSYIFVESIDRYAAEVEKLGGKVCVPKTEVPKMGYFAICLDTENNSFGLWEMIGEMK